MGTPRVAPAFFAKSGGLDEKKTPRYGYAKNINREMLHLGRAITQLTSTDVRYIPAFIQPKGTKTWSSGAGGDPYLKGVNKGGNLNELLLGFFVDDAGDHYLMAQNVNHSHGTFPVGNSNSQTITLTFDFSKEAQNTCFDITAVDVLNHKTGKIEKRSLSAGAIKVTLPAGDPILLKYRTGRPFALGK